MAPASGVAASASTSCRCCCRGGTERPARVGGAYPRELGHLLDVGLFFNTYPDPVIREVYADVRFKQAL